MSKKFFIPWLMFSVFMIGLLLAGCRSSAIKIGWVETSGPSYRTARYSTFSGIEQTKVCVGEGQNVSLDYALSVDAGKLIVNLNTPDGTPAWQMEFAEDASDTLALEAQDGGCYTLQIKGENAKGGFDIFWHTGN
jgi:hypothetical protein